MTNTSQQQHQQLLHGELTTTMINTMQMKQARVLES